MAARAELLVFFGLSRLDLKILRRPNFFYFPLVVFVANDKHLNVFALREEFVELALQEGGVVRGELEVVVCVVNEDLHDVSLLEFLVADFLHTLIPRTADTMTVGLD